MQHARPTKPEAKRWKGNSVEPHTTYLAAISKIVQEYDTDAPQFWNLNETRCTPGKYVGTNGQVRRYSLRNGSRDLRLPKFVIESRASLLAAVSAAGDSSCPLFCARIVK